MGFSQEIKKMVSRLIIMYGNCLKYICDFWDLKESLIQDRAVFEIQNNYVRKRVTRDLDLTLQRAIEKVRLPESTITEKMAPRFACR